jgi:hypothetical protein
MDAERLRSLRIEYEAGQLSPAELAAKYSLSPSRLRALATNNAWIRNLPPAPEKVYGNVERPLSQDPTEHAILTAAHVVGLHRKDVARLRTISNTLIERLGLELKIRQEGGELPDGFICRGVRESPADLLEKLSRVLVRTTEIERQAYGLKTFNPSDQANEEQLSHELQELTERVERIAREKSNT